jgi:hypothetical protein
LPAVSLANRSFSAEIFKSDFGDGVGDTRVS